MSSQTPQARKAQRARRARARIHGTADRPRLSVFRSSKHMSAQLINDDAQETIMGMDDSKVTGKEKGVERATAFGTAFAAAAKKAGASSVVFDRGSYAFHGRVKAFADATREGGLQF